jgi:hypothetical protein
LKRFWVALSLGLVAVITSAVHRDASWTPERIGEHWILEGDVHVHTSFAGALSTPIDIPLLARRTKVDFVAITEHNAWFGGWVTAQAARALTPEVLVLPSEEITNRAYHALAIGLEGRVDPSKPLSSIADDVHRQGGILVAAHPTRATWPLLLGLADQKKLDGVEVFHPTALRHDDVAREYAAFFDEASKRAGAPLLALGSSDFHGGPGLGVCRTLVFARERTAAGVLEALHAGRAVAAMPDGRLAGDPRWIAALTGAGYRSRASSIDDARASIPARRGPLERVLALAALGVMVAALLRRSPVVD